MRQHYWTRLSRVFVVFAVIAVASFIPSMASATCVANQQSCTSKYGISQAQFGSGSNINQCSTGSVGYCANASAGDLADGSASSGNQDQTRAGSGLVTNRDAYLAVTVNNAAVNLGTLSLSCTSVTTGSFSVKTYLASGYIVQTVGNPPKSSGSGSHTFSTPTTPTTPSVGTEQFGMNLVANTGNMPNDCQAPPNSIGASPLQVPDSTYSFGAAAGSAQNPNSDSYNQTGKFMYRNGDVIAYSNQSSGETDYTISYIFDMGNTTPSGSYTFTDVLVATSTF